ncbi:MAG: DUF2750 domain-containing protein [Verrucomicrobiota bacterium]
MLRNTADCEADVQRFSKRVAESEVVWYLESEEGPAVCESSDEDSEGEPLTVMLFFSDEAYARRCQRGHFEDHEIESMSLFDFLFRWLPGMSGDSVLAGPNWNQDLVGLELDPFELRELVEAELTPAQSASHAENYRQLNGSSS